MRRNSELNARLERPEIEVHQIRDGEVHEVLGPLAIGAEAFLQLSAPMIKLVEAGLITVSDSGGDLGRARAISFLADPGNWVSSPSRITRAGASSLARLRQRRRQH